MDPKRWMCLCFVIGLNAEEVFNTTPGPLRTSFSCRGRKPGYYADTSARCKVYHMCDDHGNKFSYFCPEETLFRQDALICDHARLVNCPTENLETGTSQTTEGPLSRSFQVDKRSNGTIDSQPDFVFRASVFLRERSTVDATARPTTPTKVSQTRTTPKATNFHNTLPQARTTQRTTSKFQNYRNDFARAENDFAGGGVDFIAKFDPFDPRPTKNPRLSDYQATRPVYPKSTIDADNFHAYRDRKFAEITSNVESNYFETPSELVAKARRFDGNYPYTETLRSIQDKSRTFQDDFRSSRDKNARSNQEDSRSSSFRTATELPVRALTMSLKPLSPIELQYDPYYPRTTPTTETYHTPSSKIHFRLSTTQAPTARASFSVPETIPDLNSLEDLVDRRKNFYIPRKSIK